jgi:hypothetical protein
MKDAEVPTILLIASIYSLHHILCHSTKSSLIYACNGLWDVAFFSGTVHQHTSVFHAINWSTAWGTVMSHCSRSVVSLPTTDVQTHNNNNNNNNNNNIIIIIIIKWNFGYVLKWTHSIMS